MFKKLTSSTQLKQTQTKSSVQRALIRQVQEQYEDVIAPEELAYIFSKDAPLYLARVPDTYFQLMIQNKQILFFQQSGGQGQGPWIPHLRVLHAFPFLLPKFRVDNGGTKFVVGGANVMCPGLNHANGHVPEGDLPVGAPVAVYTEGRENAAAVGVLEMSSNAIREAKAGVGITSYHHLGDGLWSLQM